MGRSSLLSVGEVETHFIVDVSSHFIQESYNEESLFLDGESYRYSMGVSYGVSEQLELGMNIPYVAHQGGRIDSFIDGWHSFFGLPTNGRENVSDDQLSFEYHNNEGEVLSFQQEDEGFGDLRLSAGWQIKAKTSDKPTAIALHGSLKLPTGDSEKLSGSGNADFAAWLSAGRQYSVAQMPLALMSSAGLLIVGQGEILEDQQRSLVWFGGLGVALQPWERVKFQLQADFHSSFYHNSQLKGIDSHSVQLAIGGAIILNAGHEIELAVVEDIVVGTSPDVVFHLAWRKRF